VIPAERKKAGREHIVPLSPAAIGLLRCLPRVEGSYHVFQSDKGEALSDMALSAVIRKMHASKFARDFERDGAIHDPESQQCHMDCAQRRALGQRMRGTIVSWQSMHLLIPLEMPSKLHITATRWPGSAGQ